jgi:hypothetical protein
MEILAAARRSVDNVKAERMYHSKKNGSTLDGATTDAAGGISP